MARKSKKSSLGGLLVVLTLIAAGVAAVVYGLATHRKHVYREKWKDYDECGMA